MKDFIAITASGAVYRVQNGFLHYQGSQGEYGFKLAGVKCLDRTSTDLNWENLSELPSLDLPVKGLSMFLDGYDEWRLSTPVVQIYEIEPEPLPEGVD